MKILIIGGAGYVGAPLTYKLWRDGHDITVLDLLLFGGESLLALQDQERYRLVAGDLRDEETLDSVMEGQDAVVLLGAIVGEPASNRDPEATYTTNQVGSEKVRDAAVRHGVGRFDQLACTRYHEVLLEDVRSWSYMKFPFISSLGPGEGWYRVGPLARMNAVDFIDTPRAEAARQELLAQNHGMPQHAVLANHWARLIEVLHCIEMIRDLLHDPDLQGADLVASGDRRQEGIGVIEAPRGNLIHHYEVDENDQVTYCNLIVSTTHNNEGLNRAVKSVAVRALSHQPRITDGMLNEVEVAIRAYDPCLSCATHALGQMPLRIEIVDPAGAVLDERTRDA